MFNLRWLQDNSIVRWFRGVDVAGASAPHHSFTSTNPTTLGFPWPAHQDDAVIFDDMINFEVNGTRYTSVPLLKVSVVSMVGSCAHISSCSSGSQYLLTLDRVTRHRPAFRTIFQPESPSPQYSDWRMKARFRLNGC